MGPQIHRLIIRADAGSEIGAGHLMRCLALAQAWKRSGGEVSFITACESRQILARLSREGIEVNTLRGPDRATHGWEAMSGILDQHPEAWVVIDGYDFGADFQKRIRNAGHPLLVIDDTAHHRRYVADIILNQNIHAGALDYTCGDETKFLLGPRYVLLRQEFMRWQGHQRDIREVASHILVTLGHFDHRNMIPRVMLALESIEGPALEVTIASGDGSTSREALEDIAMKSRHEVNLVFNPIDMGQLMVMADMAITGGGSTCWELAFMGVPSIIVILAQNQVPIAEGLDRAEAAINLGWYEDLPVERIAGAVARLFESSRRREKMVRRCQEVVDGEGAGRVLMHLTGGTLRLRHVKHDDCKLLWQWANDSEARSMAFSTERIPWEKHVEWFGRTMADPDCIHFLALDVSDTPVGQIRFDIKNDDQAEIDVSIDSNIRGAGYGSLLIDMAAREVLSNTRVRTLRAFIKPENARSIHAFEKAGFEQLGLEQRKGAAALHYVREKRDGSQRN